MAYTAQQQQRITAGLCPQCGNASQAGKTYCTGCIKAITRKRKDRCEVQYKDKQCHHCEYPYAPALRTTPTGYILCVNCVQYIKKMRTVPPRYKYMNMDVQSTKAHE